MWSVVNQVHGQINLELNEIFRVKPLKLASKMNTPPNHQLEWTKNNKNSATLGNNLETQIKKTIKKHLDKRIKDNLFIFNLPSMAVFNALLMLNIR